MRKEEMKEKEEKIELYENVDEYLKSQQNPKYNGIRSVGDLIARIIAIILVPITLYLSQNYDDVMQRIYLNSLVVENDTSEVLEFEDSYIYDCLIIANYDLNDDGKVTVAEFNLIEEKQDSFSFRMKGNNELYSLKGIEKLDKITYFDVKHSLVTDISPAFELKEATTIRIEDSKVNDISPILNISDNLDTIILINNEISDLRPLLELEKYFDRLNLDGNPVMTKGPDTVLYGYFPTLMDNIPVYGPRDIVDEEALANSPVINFDCMILKKTLIDRDFDMNGDWEISEYEAGFVKGGLKLDNLGITSTVGLEYFDQIFYVDLNRNKIENADPVLGIDNLKYLEIPWNHISWMTGTAPKLEHLVISNNWISSLERINVEAPLKTLSANSNKISDLNGLERYLNLESLGLGDSRLNSLKTDFEFSKMKQLYIDETRLKSLNGIQSFPNLEKLDLYDTDITDLTMVMKLKNLKYLFATKETIYNSETPNAEKIGEITGVEIWTVNKEAK